MIRQFFTRLFSSDTDYDDDVRSGSKRNYAAESREDAQRLKRARQQIMTAEMEDSNQSEAFPKNRTVTTDFHLRKVELTKHHMSIVLGTVYLKFTDVPVTNDVDDKYKVKFRNDVEKAVSGLKPPTSLAMLVSRLNAMELALTALMGTQYGQFSLEDMWDICRNNMGDAAAMSTPFPERRTVTWVKIRRQIIMEILGTAEGKSGRAFEELQPKDHSCLKHYLTALAWIHNADNFQFGPDKIIEKLEKFLCDPVALGHIREAFKRKHLLDALQENNLTIQEAWFKARNAAPRAQANAHSARASQRDQLGPVSSGNDGSNGRHGNTFPPTIPPPDWTTIPSDEQERIKAMLERQLSDEKPTHKMDFSPYLINARLEAGRCVKHGQPTGIGSQFFWNFTLDTNRPTQVQALLDSGSTVCGIDPKIVDEQDFDVIEVPAIEIGSSLFTGEGTVTTQKVMVPLRDRNWTGTVECFVFPTKEQIGIILGSEFVGKYQRHLDLAEPSFSDKPIWASIDSVEAALRPDSVIDSNDSVYTEHDVGFVVAELDAEIEAPSVFCSSVAPADSVTVTSHVPDEESCTHHQSATSATEPAPPRPADLGGEQPDPQRFGYPVPPGPGRDSLPLPRCLTRLIARSNLSPQHTPERPLQTLWPDLSPNRRFRVVAVNATTAKPTLPPELRKWIKAVTPLDHVPASRGEFDISINLAPHSHPPATGMYRLSDAEDAVLREELSTMLQQGKIRRSTSAFAAPVLFVAKKGPKGTELRMCFDYRRLNLITIRDRNPVPHIKGVLDQLHGARWFTSLDLQSGYHQVLIREADIHKAAFSTRYGLFEPVVMPFGLCNAPAHFQRMMDHYLRELIELDVCVVYIDDILIYTRGSREHHIATVQRAFQIIEEAELVVKLSKCTFFATEIEFLGHWITREGRRPLHDKIETLKTWPLPADKKSLLRFLGLAEYYRDNVPGFSHVSAPLHALTSASRPKGFAWSQKDWEAQPDALAAFQNLKDLLAKAVTLRFMLPTGARRVKTDASRVAVAAALEQEQDGVFQPIAFFSKILAPAQRRWPVRQLELYGITESLRTWRHYLHGHEFTVFTDHESLANADAKNPLKFGPYIMNQSVMGMIMTLQYFDPLIKYDRGADNVVADAMSRAYHATAAPLNGVRAETISDAWRDRLWAAWDQEPRGSWDSRAYRHFAFGEKPPRSRWRVRDGVSTDWRSRYAITPQRILLFQVEASNPDSWAIYVPSALRRDMIDRTHSRGHFGATKMVATTRRLFAWRHMVSDFQLAAKQCHACRVAKTPTQRPQGLPVRLESPSKPWEHVAMDFLDHLGKTNTDRHKCLVIIDVFSKMVKLFKVEPDVDSQRVREIYEDILLPSVFDNQWPVAVVCDRDPVFKGNFAALIRETPMELRQAAVGHPESDGLSERMVRTVKECVLAKIAEARAAGKDEMAWTDYLPETEIALNAAVSAATGKPPYIVALHHMPIDEDLPLATDDLREMPLATAREIQEHTRATVEARLLQEQDRRMEVLNGRRRLAETITVESYVYVKFSKMVSGTIPRAAGHYFGPFPVLARVNEGAVVIETPPYFRSRYRVVNVGDVRLAHAIPHWTEDAPTTADECRERLLRGDGAFLHLEWQQPRHMSYLVSWRNCNPAYASRVHRSVIDALPARIRTPLWRRSRVYGDRPLDASLQFRGFEDPAALRLPEA